ncbi:MAG: menaquinone reductase multiheme cytochrome c subunit QrcA [Thermodesulfobacteriota bacterium]
MTTVDDHANDVHDDGTDHATASAHRDPGAGMPVLFFIIGFAASLVIGWLVFPEVLYSKKQQPFDFNHSLHMELVDDGCESCHLFREDGTYAGVPELAQCIECHEEVQGDSKDEEIFVEEYVSKNREVPWLVYSKQPDCVFFSHAAHVKLGGMDCVTCHGPIGESTSLPVYEENRITGYSRDIWGRNLENMLCLKKNTWDRMKMDDCAECHMQETGRATSVQTKKDGCFVCHK